MYIHPYLKTFHVVALFLVITEGIDAFGFQTRPQM